MIRGRLIDPSLTADETEFFTRIPQTVLDRLVFVGGTALSGLYLGHRYSVDVDLFSHPASAADNQMFENIRSIIIDVFPGTKYFRPHPFLHRYEVALTGSSLKVDVVSNPQFSFREPCWRSVIAGKTVCAPVLEDLFLQKLAYCATDASEPKNEVDLTALLTKYPEFLQDALKLLRLADEKSGLKGFLWGQPAFLFGEQSSTGWGAVQSVYTDFDKKIRLKPGWEFLTPEYCQKKLREFYDAVILQLDVEKDVEFQRWKDGRPHQNERNR